MKRRKIEEIIAASEKLIKTANNLVKNSQAHCNQAPLFSYRSDNIAKYLDSIQSDRERYHGKK